MMEVFAGYAAHVDHEHGPRRRRGQAAARRRQHDLHLHRRRQRRERRRRARGIASTRTCSSTASPRSGRTTSRHIDELGGPKHFNHFPAAWAHAMNTPFQWTKQVASHFGGTRNPMIISWPAKIKDKGGLRSQFLHVIDIVPTLYEAMRHHSAGGAQRHRAEADRRRQLRRTRSTDANAPEPRKTQYFELLVNRGMYHDGWMASTPSVRPVGADPRRVRSATAKWELYNVDEDFSQANDLAAENPEKLARAAGPLVGGSGEVQRAAARLARRRTAERRAAWAGRAWPATRKTFVYYPGQIALPDDASPPMLQQVVDDHGATSFSENVCVFRSAGGAGASPTPALPRQCSEPSRFRSPSEPEAVAFCRSVRALAPRVVAGGPSSTWARARKRSISFSTAAGSWKAVSVSVPNSAPVLSAQDVALVVDVDLAERGRQAEGLLEHLAQRLGAEHAVPAAALARGEIGDLAAEVHRQAHVVVAVADRRLEGAGLVGVGDRRGEAGIGGVRAVGVAEAEGVGELGVGLVGQAAGQRVADRSCRPRAPCG